MLQLVVLGRVLAAADRALFVVSGRLLLRSWEFARRYFRRLVLCRRHAVVLHGKLPHQRRSVREQDIRVDELGGELAALDRAVCQAQLRICRPVSVGGRYEALLDQGREAADDYSGKDHQR